MAPFYTLSVHISVQHAIKKPRVFRSGHLAFSDEICHHTKNSCTPTVLSWIAPILITRTFRTSLIGSPTRDQVAVPKGRTTSRVACVVPLREERVWQVRLIHAVV
mgnify:CR=1 FL=1